MPEGGQNLDLSITLGDASFQASGPADLVMKALAEFRDLTTSAQPATKKTKAEGKKDEAEGASATGPQHSDASKVPLPQFLVSDAIKGNDRIATAIVAWAADHEKKATLTASQIKKYWKNTTVKVPANINRDVEVARKQGWLERVGGDYSVTGFGRKAIGLS